VSTLLTLGLGVGPQRRLRLLDVTCRGTNTGVKCSNTNFPSEISVPFKTNSYSWLPSVPYSCHLAPAGSKHCEHAVDAGTWSRHTLLWKCPVVPRAGLPPKSLRPISRLRFHTPQIPSGCLPHFCRRDSHGKVPEFVGRSLLRAFHEIVLSLNQSPITFRLEL
jgi:hypothetical protein